ncbi:hypothetical protein [Ulvibacterium sp.]|uniref:hypothetical protein n=1 Tax=Ulvibacterium sp. TaxID=2665914 RepID=UPI0026058729|nr:hypothetical protein [Ulvibacterium sp.]
MHKDFLDFNIDNWNKWVEAFFSEELELVPSLQSGKSLDQEALLDLYLYLAENFKTEDFIKCLQSLLENESNKSVKDDYRVFMILKLFEKAKPYQVEYQLKSMIADGKFINSFHHNISNRALLIGTYFSVSCLQSAQSSDNRKTSKHVWEFLLNLGVRTKFNQEKIEILRLFKTYNIEYFLILLDYHFNSSNKLPKEHLEILIDGMKEFIYNYGAGRILEYFIDKVENKDEFIGAFEDTTLNEWASKILLSHFESSHKVLLAFMIHSEFNLISASLISKVMVFIINSNLNLEEEVDFIFGRYFIRVSSSKFWSKYIKVEPGQKEVQDFLYEDSTDDVPSPQNRDKYIIYSYLNEKHLRSKFQPQIGMIPYKKPREIAYCNIIINYLNNYYKKDEWLHQK